MMLRNASPLTNECELLNPGVDVGMATKLMSVPEDYVEQIFERGVACIEDCLSVTDVETLRVAVQKALQEHHGDESVRDRGGVFAIRNITEVVPEVRQLARHPNVGRLIRPILGERALLVRGLLFNKSSNANWGIFWHQDLSIAVQRRESMPGFGPWSIKAGVQHVQPPPEVLNRMLTLRLHLDDCPAENGALCVLPGSHRGQRLSQVEAEQAQKTHPSFTCAVRAGGVVVMRPLILHSSHRSTINSQRRVVHLEFADGPLPEPLRWSISESIVSSLE